MEILHVYLREGPAQRVLLFPAVQQPKGVCRKLQENVPCIHTDWRQKKSKGVEIKLWEDGKKLQGSSLLLSVRVPWEKGSSYWSSTARQAQCECQDQQQHKSGLSEPFWVCWVSLSGHWENRSSSSWFGTVFWYMDIFNEQVLISLLLCLVRVQQVCWYE